MLYTVIAIVIAIALLFAWLLKPQPPKSLVMCRPKTVALTKLPDPVRGGRSGGS